MGASAEERPAISAHKGGNEHGPGERYESYLSALQAGADYVELDVRQTADGTLIACHDDRFGRDGLIAAVGYDRLCEIAGYEICRVGRILTMISDASSVAGAHLDLKEPGCAAAAVDQALAVLRPARIIATTSDRNVIRSLRRRYEAVPLGLSLPARARARWRPPVELVVESGANWAALQLRLARADVLAECAGRGIKTMVWTVNGKAALASWLRKEHVDVLVTDQPIKALTLRARVR